MAEIQAIYQAMARMAPPELAESWDNVGLLVDCGRPAARALTALDITPEVVGKIQALNEVAARRGQTLAEMALAWLLQKEGVTIILVSHSMEEIAEYADRVLVFYGGRICMDGSPEEVFSNKEELDRIGLEMPQIMECMWKIREAGIPVEGLSCSEAAAEELILKAMKGGSDA